MLGIIVIFIMVYGSYCAKKAHQEIINNKKLFK